MARRSTRPPPDDPFDAADHQLLRLLEAQNIATRAVLCTLARYGVAFRRREPERTRHWIDLLSRHPLFKGGQFLFDLLEWDDFMLDGEPPALLDPSSVLPILDRFARVFDFEIGPGLSQQAVADENTAEELPPLQPGFHLYRDVVLGLLSVARAAAAAAQP